MQEGARKPAEEILRGLETTSAKIRALAAAGYLRTEIRDLLGIRYQHVHKVLEDAGIGEGLQRTVEVSRILAVCNETRTPIVPQGGNTGLVGGQIPTQGEVLLSLTRMNRIRAVNIADDVLIAEAGVVLAQVQKAAEDVGRLLPLSLAAEGSCTIGGNISTNAGGVNVLRCDGSVCFVQNSIALGTWRALGTIAGGEVIGDY